MHYLPAVPAFAFVYSSGSQNVVFGSAAASPVKLLEMQILRPHLRHATSELPGLGPSNLCLKKAPKGF